jgi:hypothetical protein
VFRNTSYDSHSESAASRIQRAFRRSLSTRHSNRSLKGGHPTSSVGAAIVVAAGVGATTVVALVAGAVGANDVSFTASMDLNEFSTGSMYNDLEANISPTEASDNDEMSSEYPADDVPDATNPYGSGEDVMADSLGYNTDSNDSHSSPEDEEENEYKQVGWVGAKGIISHVGYTSLGMTAALGRKLITGGGDPVDEDDVVAATQCYTGGPNTGGTGGPGGGPQAAPVTVTVVP